MTTKPPRISENWLTRRRKIVVFKTSLGWFAMDGRSDQAYYNDRTFTTHAEAVEYAFRLAQTTEAAS